MSYRLRPPAADASYQAPIDHLKLFQPVHGHFNLVAATLVCRVVGLPDKAVDPGAEEAVTFVMRRLAGRAPSWPGRARAGAPSRTPRPWSRGRRPSRCSR